MTVISVLCSTGDSEISMCTLIRVDAIFTLTKVHSFGFLKQDANNYGVFC